MAVVAATPANWTTVLANAAAGDVVSLGDGEYGSVTLNVSKTAKVTITPENRGKVKFTGNPSIVLQSSCKNLTFDGLFFDLSKHKDAWGYPDNSAIRIYGTENVTIRNCTFDFCHQGITFPSTGLTKNLLVEWNKWTRCGMDVFRLYRTNINAVVRNNWSTAAYVDTAVRQTGDNPSGRHHNSVRHPDLGLQTACIGSDSGHTGVLIENNRYEGIPDYAHVIFFFNEAICKDGSTLDHQYHRDITIRNNRVIGGHTNAIAMGGVKSGSIERNWISRHPSGYDSNPTINIYPGVGTSSDKVLIKDNVVCTAVQGMKSNVINSKMLDNCTLLNNTVIANPEATVAPTGWVEFAYGPYAYEGGEQAPEGPTISGEPALPTGASAITSATGTSVAVTMPANVAAGEMILVECAVSGNPTISVNTGVSGNGWTKLTQTSQSTNITLVAFYKAAAAGGGADALTLTLTASNAVHARASRIKNHGGVAYLAASATTGANSNPPSLTPAGGLKDYFWRVLRAGDGTGVATVAPSGFGGLATSASTISLSVAQRAFRGTVLDPGAFTSTSLNAVAATLAIPPTAIDANRPNYHGRVDTYYNAGQINWTGNGTTQQAYSGVIIIPKASPAWDEAGGDPSKIEVYWKLTSHASWRSCRVATPSTNAADSMRFEMLPSLSSYNSAYPESHRDHAVLAGGSMSDIEWRYKLKTKTLYSAKSTYTSGFAAPAAATPCSVTSALHANTGYTIGQTAVANFDYDLGSGTFTSLKVDWFLGGTLVETDSGLASGTKTASYTTTAQGALTYRVTLVTSTNTATLVTPTSATVSTAPVAPAVTSATIAPSAITVGQTATVTIVATMGTGTFVSLTVEWFLGGTLVETDQLASTVRTASYTTTAAGSLTARVRAETSVSAATRTSDPATVTAAATAPTITQVQLDNAAFTVGQTATVTFTATMGSGTFTSLVVEWLLGATIVETDTLTSAIRTATYKTTAAGTLTARVRAVTSAGTDTQVSAASTVQATDTPPDVTSVTLDDTAYTIGETAAVNFDYTLGTGAFNELRVSWHLTGAIPRPRPSPDPAIVAIAAAAGDYICAHTNSSGAVIGEGTSTAYHNLVPEIIGLDVWRGGMGNRARLATQLRRFLATDRDPTGKGGLATQYDIHAALAILCAKLAPDNWWTSEFTATERAKFDLVMAGMAYGAAWSGSASGNSSVSLTNEQNQPKNTPNWRTSIPATLWAWAAYRGGYGTPDITGVLADLASFSKSAFYTSVNNSGLTNLATTFRSRGGSTGYAGPTNAVVEAALDNWQFIARTGSTHWALSDIAGIMKAELEFCFSNTIEAGLNGGVGVTYNNTQRGLIMAGADDLPNAGLVGMLHQLNTTDGGGSNSSLTARSAMSYAMRTYNNAADLVLTCIIGGLIDPSTLTGAAALADRCGRGVTDFAYKHDQGYRSFSKGGGTSNNEDWTASDSMVQSNRVPVQLSVWWDIVDPALRGDGKVATTRPASGTKTATFVPAQAGTLSSRVRLETTAGSDIMASSGSVVSASATAPTVTSIEITNSAFTVGQVATANFVATMGTGTFSSLTVEWFLNGSLVETDTLTSTVRTASYTTTATGTLTARATAVTSAGSANRTSAPATVTAAPVAPVVTSVTIVGSSLTVGQVATANFVATMGNGTFTSLVVEWFLSGTLVETDTLTATERTASYTTTATGTLTARATAVTSAGTATRTSDGTSVVPAPVAPSVTGVQLDNTGYIVGQTAVATLTATMGNGAHASLVVEWRIDGVLVETISIAPSARSAAYTTTAVGALTARAVATTSAGTSAWTSGAANVAPVPVLPEISGLLDKAAYTIGETAVIAFDYTLGTGTFLGLVVDWVRDGVVVQSTSLPNGTKGATRMVGAAGNLRCRLTLTTTIGVDIFETPVVPVSSPAPDAPSASDWGFSGVVSAPGFVDRFTGQIQLTAGTGIADSSVIGMAWTGDDGLSWRPCINRGVLSGRTVWEMAPSAAIGDAAHTVAYAQTMSGIRIRISTATGTSPISAAPGQSFTAPSAPPPIEEEGPAAPTDADWRMAVTPAPGAAGYFTGLVTFADTIDDATVLTVEWTGADGAWHPTTFVGLDAAGKRSWRLESETEADLHIIAYGQQLQNIRIRYSVAAGQSPASSGAKAVQAPAAPPPAEHLDPGETLAVAGILATIGGLPMRVAQAVRPASTPTELTVSDDGGILSMVLPALPQTAIAWIVSYGGGQQECSGGDIWTAPRAPGQRIVVLTAYDAQLRGSVSRFIFVPPEAAS